MVARRPLEAKIGVRAPDPQPWVQIVSGCYNGYIINLILNGMENQNFLERHKTAVIVIGIIVVVLLWGVSSYNSFVRGGEQITAQWAQVENQYQRRFDLIPNIVSTVKGVAKQEQEVFGAIAEARTRYSGATTANAKAQAATQLEAGLGRLLVIAEQYPALQSSGAYRDLIVSLEGTENRISVERMKYNDLVRIFDTNVKTFPTSIVAKLFGVTERAYFDIPTGNQINPQVQF
ncbi:MAG: LemA family protein [Parcubacteria group bacterium GW2011_GWF2_39_8b]|nr:MAG: LemA family protein [Parcubacteria group bacterium GW2011_GWF2_39_8b]KKR45292.1 MAG: LemA family protein [Parcubacteria group bacterium GW2011_GWA2_40_14]